MAEVMCRACKRRFDREKFPEFEFWIQPTVRHYYHTQCWKAIQADIKDIKTQTDIDYLDGTYQYLNKCVRIDLEWFKFKGQWDKLIKDGCTEKGLYFTARYAYDIKKLGADKANGGIGILPYLYKEATLYWTKRYEENPQKIQDIINQINDLKNEVKVEIKVKPRAQAKKFELVGDEDGDN